MLAIKGRVRLIRFNVVFICSLEIRVSEAFQRTIETFGTLDIVVNNAGIFDDFQWEKQVDINLVGQLNLYFTSIHKCLQTKEQCD